MAMKELLRTTDPVFLSWMEATLRAEGIEPVILDFHTSIMEGSTYAIPRRVMVTDSHFRGARQILTDAGEGYRLARL